MSKRYGVLHVVSGLSISSGGPSRSVVGLVDHLAAIDGMEVSLVTQKRSGEQIITPSNDSVRFVLGNEVSRFDAKLATSVRKKIGRCLQKENVDIVHVHGIWSAACYWAAALAKSYGKQLILHPRGMLEPWCLAHKAWKKRVALALYQRRALNKVDLFFATAEQELESIRRLGLRQPIAVVPNGVNVSPIGEDARVSREAAMRQALFLSRVHPVKGLMNLVRAWATVQPSGWRLVIAGPNEGGHWQEVEREITRLGLKEQINYVGPVEGKEKADLFQQSDLFVLPTFSENFGIVIAEALAHGLPVITTQGTPWKDLESFHCGWWIETGVEPLAVALRQAMALSDEERRAMGARGRAYVQRYDWKAIAEQTAAAYRWLLSGDSKPECVFSD